MLLLLHIHKHTNNYTPTPAGCIGEGKVHRRGEWYDMWLRGDRFGAGGMERWTHSGETEMINFQERRVGGTERHNVMEWFGRIIKHILRKRARNEMDWSVRVLEWKKEDKGKRSLVPGEMRGGKNSTSSLEVEEKVCMFAWSVVMENKAAE